MEAYKSIIGHEKIIGKFGYWPSFHDAEVLSMCFNREHIENGPGPSLMSRIHAFEMTREEDDKGHLKCIKHCIITLEFDSVDELEFNGFNHQNVLFSLDIERYKNVNGWVHKVQFSSSFGIECAFQCRMIRVSSVEEGMPEKSIYRK